MNFAIHLPVFILELSLMCYCVPACRISRWTWFAFKVVVRKGPRRRAHGFVVFWEEEKPDPSGPWRTFFLFDTFGYRI